MHEHLFYQIERPRSVLLVSNASEAFARLYLAAGVTTIRTAGTADFAGDLQLKQQMTPGRCRGRRLASPGLT